MSFEEFEDDRHLGYQNGRILAILNFYVATMFPSSFGSIQLTVWEMSFEGFQDGGHLGYRNGTILAILNLCVAPVPSVKFWLNLTYGLGGNVV